MQTKLYAVVPFDVSLVCN